MESLHEGIDVEDRIPEIAACLTALRTADNSDGFYGQEDFGEMLEEPPVRTPQQEAAWNADIRDIEERMERNLVYLCADMVFCGQTEALHRHLMWVGVAA
jgi:hypothetical protein